MSRQVWHSGRGPFRADQIRSGDPYELSQGHPIVCAPTGQEGAQPNGLGFAVLDSDPAVKRAGVDAGLQLAPDNLRAPDVAVNFTPGEGTWATTAPLVVEYAGKGQDEADLRDKIVEFHGAGVTWVWVVRLATRSVEVHERGAEVRVVGEDGTLTAPGVLALPVPVRALFDRDAAHETTLRNILAARGYASLDGVREEARREGVDLGRREGVSEGALAARREVLRMLLKARGIVPVDGDLERIERCVDTAALDGWIRRAGTAATRDEVFAPSDPSTRG
jgi:hypothetical protein